MLRVVVYGRGRGGEAVAEYLEEELGVVEVVRVIDWSPAVEASGGGGGTAGADRT